MLLSVGIVLLTAIMVVVSRKFIRQIRSNKILAEENTENLKHIASQSELIEAQEDVLTKIAYTQSHLIRGPVSTILGLLEIFNFDDLADPGNREILRGISVTTNRLDNVIREIVDNENNRENAVNER